MADLENKSVSDSDKISDGNSKERKEPQLKTNLKTTTEISRTSFFLSKFDAKDVFHEEKLPKTFKDLDHLLNKILLSLEETENVFLNQAKDVMDKDLILINWRLKLQHLEKCLKEKQKNFERIDQTVQCFLKLSSHIDNILIKLEKELPEQTLIANAFKYTPIRMNIYDSMLKTNINQKDMLQQISNAVLSINEIIKCNPSDPVEQFTRILSLHMEILRTIERRIGQVEEQSGVLKALQRFYEKTKKQMPCNAYFLT